MLARRDQRQPIAASNTAIRASTSTEGLKTSLLPPTGAGRVAHSCAPEGAHRHDQGASDPMTKRGNPRRATVLALLLVATVAAACSSTDETPPSAESNFPAPSTATTTPASLVTTIPRASCSAATLGAAAAGTFEGAALVDVVCEQEAATATLTNGPDGELVVLFALQGGSWALVGNAPVDGDLASVAPAGFSPTALPAWQRLRNARLSRPADGGSNSDPTPPSSVQKNPDTGETEVCITYDADYVICSVPTTAPPPAVPDPENPDAPVAPPVTSNFCRYNYNDTRCVDSNQTFQPRSTEG